MSDRINKRNFNDVLAEALHKFNRKTRADGIRAMTDEELAEFMNSACGCPPSYACPLDEAPCEKCWLGWLREEITV